MATILTDDMVASVIAAASKGRTPSVVLPSFDSYLDVTEEVSAIIASRAAADKSVTLTIGKLLDGSKLTTSESQLRSAIRGSLKRAAEKANGETAQVRHVVVELSDGSKCVALKRV